MARKPNPDKTKLLIHPLTIRISEATLVRMRQLQAKSGCRSVRELARKILEGGKINLYHHDASLSGPMEELSLIRRELKAIGVNLNQQTRYFNAVKSDREKLFHAQKTLEIYLKADAKMERLFALISKLAERWLPRS